MSKTISQALRRVKKLKGELASHLDRARVAVTHRAEQVPAFAFSNCIELAAKARGEMLHLQTDIAVANSKNTVDWEGKPMSLALAARTLAELRGEIAWVKALPVKAQGSTTESEQEYVGGQYVTVTKTFTCHLPEADQAALVERLQGKFDALNDLVETANHKTTI
jgi:hypothetical protein